MADFPSLPLWTDAFLSDTMHLDATETGAYLLLLMTAWRRPNNDLPDDDLQLRRFARCTAKSWKTVKPRIMIFWELKDGKWRQKRLDKERARVLKNSEVRRASIAKRWAKPLETNEHDHSNVSRENGVSNTNQNQNQNQQSLFGPSGPNLVEWPRNYREIFWKLYPHKVGKPKALKKLDDCRKRGIVWQEVIGGLERYIQGKPADRSWMNPETFINQERWTDQPAPSHGVTKNGKAHRTGSLVDSIQRELAELEREDETDPPVYPGHIHRLPRG